MGVQRMEKNKYLLKRSQLLRCHITGRLPLISPRVRVLPNITPIQPYVGAIKEVAERYKTFLLFQRFVSATTSCQEFTTLSEYHALCFFASILLTQIKFTCRRRVFPISSGNKYSKDLRKKILQHFLGVSELLAISL